MKTILVIDDSATVREQVRTALEPQGYCVVEAVDGLDGKKKIGSTSELSMIICDVNMPNLNGIDMLCEMQRERMTTRAAMLMMTTEGNARMIQRAQDLGVRAWIVKPFKLEQLLAAVKRMTDARH